MSYDPQEDPSDQFSLDDISKLYYNADGWKTQQRNNYWAADYNEVGWVSDYFNCLSQGNDPALNKLRVMYSAGFGHDPVRVTCKVEVKQQQAQAV